MKWGNKLIKYLLNLLTEKEKEEFNKNKHNICIECGGGGIDFIAGSCVECDGNGFINKSPLELWQDKLKAK